MPELGDIPTLRFSTGALPAHQRVAAFRESYGREVLRLEIEALGETEFASDLTARMLPGLGIVSAVNSPFRVGRTRALLADGNDALTVQIASTPGFAAQLGREVDVGVGDAIMLSNADVGFYTFPTACEVFALSVPRAALAPLVGDLDVALVRAMPAGSEALRLLKPYCLSWQRSPAMGPELEHLAVSHVYDLLAVAIGATRDGAALAKNRGMRAARLAAIKGYINDHLGNPTLTVGAISRRYGISQRYVQMLFEPEGTTFSQFVRDARLARAHRILSDPHEAHRSISAIAFESGFGDLSYFNHAFRRRYGASPSDVRAAAARERLT